MDSKPMLFSDDPAADVLEIRQLFRNFFVGHGAMPDCVPDDERLTKSVVSYCYIDAGKFGGVGRAGAFKKVAIFTDVMKSVMPIQLPLPDQFFSRFKSLNEQQIGFLREDPKSVNTIVAFDCARFLLTKARITYEFPTGEPAFRELGNPILVSEHSWCDIIIALKGNGNVRDAAVIYELLAYKDNPNASYPPTV